MNEEIQAHVSQLLNTQSPDESIQKPAEMYVSHLLSNDIPNLLRLSCGTILEESSPTSAIALSYIFIKQCSIYLLNNWKNLHPDQKLIMKSAIRKGILSNEESIRNLSAYCFCLIVKCDMSPSGLLKIITGPICNPQYPPICTVGCFMVLKELYLNGILNDSFELFEESGNVICSAFKVIMENPKILSFSDFLEFLLCFTTIFPLYHRFYYNEESQKSILVLLNGVFPMLDGKIHHNLYNLLFEFFRCFYDNIDQHMHLIFEITVNSLNLIDPLLIRISLNFWIRISKYERGIKYSKHIIELAAPNFIEPLIILIIKYAPPKSEIEEVNLEDFNEVNISQTAANCLRHFSKNTSHIYIRLKDLFLQKCNSEDWRERVCSLFTLWCILGDEENFHQTEIFFQSIFPDVLKMIDDKILSVKDYALSIISVYIKKSSVIATNIKINHSIRVLFMKMIKKGAVDKISAKRMCDIIYYIAKQNRNTSEMGRSFIDGFGEYVKILFFLFTSDDLITDFRISDSCTEAIVSVFLATPNEHTSIMGEKLGVCVNMINQLLSASQFDKTSSDIQRIIQHCCIIIWSIAKRIGVGISPEDFSKPIMECLIRCLNLKSLMIHDEGLTTLSIMISSLGRTAIIPYLPNIFEIFVFAQLSGISAIIEKSAQMINLLLNMLRSDILNYGDIFQRIVFLLFSQVQEDVGIPVKTKMEIFSVLANIIKIMGLASSPYVGNLADKLFKYQTYPLNPLNPDDVETASLLYSTLLKCYTALSEADIGEQFLLLYVQMFPEFLKIFDYINKIPQCITPQLKYAYLNFVRAVVDRFPQIQPINPKIKILINGRKMKNILNNLRKDEDEEIQTIAIRLSNRCASL